MVQAAAALQVSLASSLQDEPGQWSGTWGWKQGKWKQQAKGNFKIYGTHLENQIRIKVWRRQDFSESLKTSDRSPSGAPASHYQKRHHHGSEIELQLTIWSCISHGKLWHQGPQSPLKRAWSWNPRDSPHLVVPLEWGHRVAHFPSSVLQSSRPAACNIPVRQEHFLNASGLVEKIWMQQTISKVLVGKLLTWNWHKYLFQRFVTTGGNPLIRESLWNRFWNAKLSVEQCFKSEVLHQLKCQCLCAEIDHCCVLGTAEGNHLVARQEAIRPWIRRGRNGEVYFTNYGIQLRSHKTF